ncbi:MAG: flagellar basal-body MS-ring/collar protein FliF, partial [Leptospiraceae bacterium]|nr:flagellar basal-body MS-ring/collar protein FliF [Leptospiraceae bacterium]
MPPFIIQFWERLKGLNEKLDTTKRIILGAALLVVVVALVLIGSMSSEKPHVVLFKGMETKDFAAVTQKLSEMGFPYTTSGTDTIFIPADRREAALVALAQDNLIPQGVHGWELFDIDKWSETQFEKDVKKQRALTGAIARTLEKVRGVERAQVNIAFPSEELFQEKTEPVTAAVLLEYKPGVEKLSVKEIKGIETLVARSVP